MGPIIFPQTGLPGALGLVGRGFGPAGRAGLNWAWGLAVLGALAGLGVVLGVLGALAGLGVVLGVGFGCAGHAGLGWVGALAGLGVVLGVGFGVLGVLAGLGVVLGVLGALAGLGVVLGVGFGRAGRAGCAGRTALGWAWGWASAVIVFSSSNAINKQTTQNTKLKGKDRPIMNSKS